MEISFENYLPKIDPLAAIIEKYDFIKIDNFKDAFNSMLKPFEDLDLDIKLDLSPYPSVQFDTNELK